MKLTLNRQIWLLCAGFLSALAVVTIFSNINSRELTLNFDEVANVLLPAVRNMTLADMMHDGLRAVVFGAITAKHTGNEKQMEEIQKEALEKSDLFRGYLSALEQMPLQKKTLASILETKPEMEGYIQETLKIVEMTSTRGVEVAYKELPVFDEKFKILEEKMGSLGELIEKDADKARSESEHFKFLETLNLFVSSVCGLFCLFLGIYIAKSLSKQMRDFSKKMESVGEALDSTSTELFSVSQNLAQESAQSVSSLQKTVTSLEHLTAAVKTNSVSAELASQLSTKSYEASQSGSGTIEKMMLSMQTLKVSATQMEEIINVIDDISFQTNLLALNASVEAARAGEMGKGFAVVAEAVRTLASRSAESAKSISNLIQQNLINIRTGDQDAVISNKIMLELLARSKEINDLNNSITTANFEQSQGISGITASMNELDSAAQRNAQLAEGVSHTSEQISSLSSSVGDLVAEFKLLLGK